MHLRSEPSISIDRKTPRVFSGPIAVIGMSGRYPGGANSPALLWSTLKSGRDAVGEAKGDRWDLGYHHPDPHRLGRVYTKSGGFLDHIDGFDAEFFGMSPREVRQVDPQHRLLLELAWEAHEDAGIAPRSRGGSDTGVFVGISSNDYAALVGPGHPDAYSNTGSSFSIAANRISYIFDFHGPSVAVDTACSSSIVCVHQACSSLLAGECSTALAGGISILTHIRPWLGFAKASMLSPTGRCKSFDASGDGYVRSEGGGLVLLKPLADAERDGDRILGVILATGVNSDGKTMGLSMPNAEAQEKLLRKVYSQCNVAADDVFYVEAHGTGTAVGDPIECEALGKVLGAPRSNGSRCLIGSVKSNIGHLEAASGIAGLTKALLTLKHREIPGNLHFNTPNPKIDFENWKLEVVTAPHPLPNRAQPVVVGVNSFGFGGTNAHVALQEYRRPAKRAISTVTRKLEEQENPNLLILSGHSEAALNAVAGQYALMLRNTDANWDDLCAAAATCRSLLRYRLVVAAASAKEAADKLDRFVKQESVARLAKGTCGTAQSQIAFVYSGNGPQWWGMGRELLAENAIFRAEIEAIDAMFTPLAGWSLIEEMRRPETESRIGLTEIAQPMLFAQQVALTAVLRGSGIEPSAVLGHSVGEAAAAFACGALTREQATRVIFHRSTEQAKTAGQGRMAAISVSAEEARAEIAKIDGWLELAATNSPSAVTVAGDPKALEQLVSAMTAAGKFARVLPLNYPFHTKAMDPIRDSLVDSLGDLSPRTSDVKFISTVDGAQKPGTELDAQYWFRNVREPVRFHKAVTALLKNEDIAVFLEIGPHPVLKDYVAQSAKAVNAAAVALPTLKRPGRQGPEPESDNLWTAICACHAHGTSAIESLFARPANIPELPLYPWQHQRHWRGTCQLPDVFSPIVRDHPLLGHRVPCMAGLWENPVDINQLGYLKDHVVQNSVLFPAAGYIELALAAAHITLGKGTLDVENFEVLRPLTIPSHGDPIIQTAIDARDGTFELSSRQDRDSTDWTLHARGRISRSEIKPDLLPASLNEIAARLPHVVSAEAHYADSTKRGLQYGKTFQGVHEVRLSPADASTREALAEIRLDEMDAAALKDYLAHPSLLDSCIQVMITLIAQNEKRDCSTIPVHLGRVRSYVPLPNRVFCHVVMCRESERSAVADFRLIDAEGNLLLSIDEARCQKVDFHQVGAAPLTSEWWRPDPSTPPLAALPPLPSPSDTRVAVSEEIGRIAIENDRAAFYREIRPRLQRLAGAYAARAIAALEPGDAVFDLPRLARKGKVRRDQIGLLGKLVRMAQEDGQLTAENGGWRWNSDRTPEAPEALWRGLFQDHPRYQAELLLLAHAGEHLSAKLRGEPVEDAGAAMLEQLQDTSPFQQAYNQIARATIERIVAAWPKDRPMRILEIAGSGGGLAAWLLPVLPAERVDYLFTDASESAIGRAEHRFASHRFARFALLDPSRDFSQQGQPDGYFDLVIGAGALGAGEDAQAVLSRVRRVLAPGGQLLAIEPHTDRFVELVLDRPSPMTADDLISAGFEDAVALDDAVAAAAFEKPQQSILLASSLSMPADSAAQANPETASPEARRWMVVAEGAEATGALCNELVRRLTAAGQDVCVKSFDGSGDELKASVLAAISAEQADNVLYLAAASDAASETGTHLIDTQERRIITAVNIVQAIESSRQDKACQLTFVTRGAFRNANGAGPLDPAQAALLGLGRVIGNELSNLDIRMIDVHCARNDAVDASWLAAELLRKDAETEVQLCAGVRYVNRERLTTLTDEARHAGISSSAFALDFAAHGGLDSLYLRTLDRKVPGANQVEIAVKSAGLNFRDVLWSMGMLPEEAVEHGFSGPTIGMECAGEIVSVGASVTNLKPGDRVVAFASSCFASHVTTDAGSVAKIPDSLDFASAATIPTAFLTAYYALDYLARLEPGEIVLVHGAAGGVGLAAIQIAKLKGAKVIGTAGSTRKRRMLEMLGVDHVLNSRSLEFADEVMKITGGVGVDVVLNSLAGEAITKSLGCLRPFGRFLEIGKRDLYANSRIGLRPFRNNLSYFGIDADTLLIERADLARKIFTAVIAHFAVGELRPLPFQEVPISRAAEAFRAMQQSRHVGKIVVSMQLDRPNALTVVRSKSPVKANATYIVTGGLGGFGLATAEWLVEQGATSLALLSRRGATTDEAAAGIKALEAMGAVVRPFAVDISDESALNAVLATIRSEMAPITGVIHSAAVIEDAPVLTLPAEQISRVFRPKLLGAWNLHHATLADPIDMFVLYSSSSAVIGNPGQGAYVAANLYLDALAMHRRANGLHALSVGWGAIKDAGFLTRHQAVAGMLKTRTGLDATPAREALADLGRLLAVNATRTSVARFDLQRLGQMLPGARVPRFLPIIPKGAEASLQNEQTLGDLLKTVPQAEQAAFILARVQGHAARVLGTSAQQIRTDQALSELGLDSLMAVELASGLERDLGRPISVMQMLSAGSLAAIAQLVLKTLGLEDDEPAAPAAQPATAAPAEAPVAAPTAPHAATPPAALNGTPEPVLAEAKA